MKNNLLRQFIMLSKLTFYGIFLQCLFIGVLLASNSEAQKVKKVHDVYVTLDGKEFAIKQIFEKIEENSDFEFSYYVKGFDSKKKIKTINGKVPVSEVLMQISKEAGISFRQINNVINVRKSENPGMGSVVEIVLADVDISGKITDENNQGLPGASVVQKGTTNGTTTDLEGNYKLSVPEETVLTISFVGYMTQEVIVGNQAVIDIKMELDAAQLDEIVVIGYGSVKRSDVTGAVSSIKGDEMSKYPNTSIDGAMQGRAAGVQIVQTSGQPGGGASVRIRGSNSISAGNEPLYVIDGMPIYSDNSTIDNGVVEASSLNPLATLNSQDIESVEILKDASATAIYGSRGANGVILITTKRGNSTQGRINLRTSFGVQKVANMFEMLNATEYAEYANEAYRNGRVYGGNPDPGKYPAYTEAQIASYGEGTSWIDELLRTAPRTNYGITISGGNKKTNYSISGDYLNQQGIIINSDYERASLRINLNQQISERIRISANMAVSRSWSDQAYAGAGYNIGAGTSVVLAALSFNPILPVVDPATGEYTFQNRHIGEGDNSLQAAVPFYNPVAYANLAVNQSLLSRTLSNLTGEYDILGNLTFKTNIGLDLISSKQNHFVPGTIRLAAGTNGRARIGSVQNYTLTNENTVNYKKTFNEKHAFDIVGGFSVQKYYQESLRASAKDFASDAISYHSLGAGAVQDPSVSGTRDWSLLSYLGRVNYNINSKYLFTFTARADGSSRFGKGNQFGFFPSGAFAWRISEESFMKGLSSVSSLKLRASFGYTGNQEIPLYQSVSTLSETRYILGQSEVTGFGPNRIANDDLKWETTRQLDIGVDLGLFEERLQVTLDLYHKKTTDLLLEVFLPTSSGFSSAIQNIGATSNKGMELALDGNVLTGEFKLDAKFNISTNQNEVLNLGDEEERVLNVSTFHPASQPVAILKVGEGFGNFYGFATDGFFNNQEEIDAAPDQSSAAGSPAIIGAPKFIDQNKDGIVNSEDRAILGNAFPDFSGGFSTSMSYKGFDLSTQFTFSLGNEVLNANRQWLEFGNGRQNGTKDLLNRWSPEKTVEENSRALTKIARNPTTLNPFKVYDRYIEDGSYLRLNNIQLGYNIPVKKLLGLNSARIYVSGQNLLTITNYGGFDPEVNRFGQDNILRGFDVNAYPTAKTFLVGINIGL